MRPAPARCRIHGTIRYGASGSTGGLASWSGRGKLVRGRLPLFQVQHGRPSVQVVLRQSVEFVTGANEGDVCSRRLLEDDPIPLGRDGARTREPIPPFERISGIPGYLKGEGEAPTGRRMVTGDVPERTLPGPTE